MQNSDPNTAPSKTQGVDELLDPMPKTVEISILDRSAPGWALWLGNIFSVGVFFCLASIAVFSIFFQSLVVQDEESNLAPLLVMVGVVPMFGILLFEYAHAKALAGYRHLRKVNAARAKAVAAVMVVVSIEILHPLAGTGAISGVLLGALGLVFLKKLKRIEPMWDFVSSEAASVLSGRDKTGYALATMHAPEHALSGPMQMAMTGFAGVSAFGVASWLAAEGVLASPAVAAVALLSLWSTDAILRYVRHITETPPLLELAETSVEPINDIEFDGDQTGLKVDDLTVFSNSGKLLLSEISFQIPPGSITGIIGDSGAGKSLLFQALVDPFALQGLRVRGSVRGNNQDLWLRHGRDHNVPAVLLPETPILLPTSGANNLACFRDGASLEQGRHILEKMVFSSELVSEICECTDATTLPGMQKRMLAFSRAFLMSPNAYLFDRPEDGLPEKQIAALLQRLQQEARHGRAIMLATDNRALLEGCDTLIVIQDGRIIDKGDASDVRGRQAAGWARFVGVRNLDIDDNLETWIRAQFKRPGDEINRRKVCHIASEMLTFSCQSMNSLAQQSVIFEFKHFVGYCLLSLQDSDAPIGAAQLDKAQQAAKEPDTTSRLSPLASIISKSMDVEASAELERRRLLVKIETLDLREEPSHVRDQNVKSES